MRHEIRDDAGFFDLGMDSLMAVELHRRLEQGFGRQLPATLAMDHPRLSDAAEYLLGDVLGLAHRRRPSRTRWRPVTRRTSRSRSSGVACRFPGARDAEAFWEVLAGGVDVIREIPDDRFDVNEYYDPDPDAPGKIYTRYGGFLDEIDGFDPEFFGISPREAVWIDPQQRLVLETAWEGLERAGYSPAALRGSRSGVYVGVGANEYSHLLSTGSVETIEAHFITGNATERHRGPGCLRARIGRSGGGGGYRVQLVAGGRPPGLPGVALRRLRSGAGRWGERAAEPGDHHCHLARQDAFPRRSVQDLRRRRGRLCAQ